MPETMRQQADRTFRSAVRVAVVSIALGVVGLVLVQGVRVVAGWAEPSVDLTGPPFVSSEPASGEGRLRFAVASMVSAEKTFSTYRSLVQAICRGVGREDAFVLRPSYADVRQALERGELDVAMVCTGTYVHSVASGRIRLLVQPEFEEGLAYRCVIIVPAHSEARSLEDLRGKVMAFTDRESNTGYLAALVNLDDLGLDPRSMFAKTIFTGNHDRSVQAVAASVVDAAAIDELILESMLREDPALGERVRVLWSSETYGPPPVVVPAGIDPELEEALREAFLSVHDTPQGRAMLSNMGIRRFVLPEPQSYMSSLSMFRRYQAREADGWR